MCDTRHNGEQQSLRQRGKAGVARAWLHDITSRLNRSRKRHPVGFTLIELILAVLILGTLASLAVPKLHHAIEKARVAKAIGDLKALSTDISSLDSLPNALADIGRGGATDPWGNPYRYTKLDGTPKGARMDKFLVPLNTDFDLYSMGPDGVTALALTAKQSKDDIIRANDGGYVGPASTY